ncbi:MAG: hypothetical protein BRC26_00310, partial [Nanohaloarchaea archaeon QH_8_44_6]
MDLDKIPDIAKYLSVVFLFAWIGRSTVWNFLPVFFKQHVNSVFLIGLMTSLPSLVPIFFDIPVGNLVQKVGEKFVILLGLTTAVLPGIMYFTAVPLFLVAGKAFEGLAKVFIWNGGWSLSLKSADPEIESETNSIFLLGVNLAAIVGPVIGGFLIAAKGFDLTFALWVFSAWLGALTFYLYVGL